MDSGMIADLKQFISAELHQQATQLKGEIITEVRGEMHAMRDELRGEMHEIKDEIIEALGDTMHVRDEAVDEQITSLDTRVAKLERLAA